ncbi:putative pentatricopeptide repeat-containing protein [Cardamine amara subsp. amara]|uniref:Pentatricopeptide repeat-containing protein n=1 Tax=Cardamine amara subsp. amara TaxID=228776 RepID=A0ABD1BJC9_CARAN
MKRINVGLRLRYFQRFRIIQTRKVASSTLIPDFELKSPHGTSFHDNLLGQVLDTYPDLKTLRTVHCRIILEDLRCNSSLGVKLMRAYSALKDVASARKVFEEIPERNVIIINVMIRSYVNNGFYREGIQVFGMMFGFYVRPDHYTFPCILKACSCSGNIVIGKKIHGSATRVGLSSTLFVGNGLVSMYGKCGFLAEARLVLDEMSRRDVVSWNSLVAGYAQNQRFDDALEVCREMESVKISHDAGTMASLLPAVTNTTTENVMYVKDMFFNMGKKSLVSWNVMIGVYMKNAMPVEAVELYSRMEADGFEPDAVSITSVLPACGDTSALSTGKKIHEYINRKKLIPNLLLENALIDMYAKCGCLDRARDVFENMRSRDIVSWTAMISAYGVSGKGPDAVALFSKMQDSGVVPDSIAFVTTLAACSHAGLLEEGRSYFKLMTEHYKITPRLEHLACMVDLFGRAGKVKEAYRFIQEMPMEPNERVWGALLGACRVHSDTDIGLLAADKLFQLAPEQSGYYVLLSNIYAKAGRWEEVTNIRRIMKSKGLKKNPGASNVEVNGEIHTFLVGDRSHPHCDKIYRKLDVLVKKMKELGYVPDSESALHDVEEEDKETHLAVHSEKLAIVYALMNTKEEEDSNSAIRITKNLRICGDCHVAAKLISQITSREIIIRDTNRFHVFQFGVCSCGDYW